MRMFNALGLNEELLTQYNFQFIIIPFNNSFLKTYRKRWIAEGIKSPFCNENVDRQILLSLDKINMNWEEHQLQSQQINYSERLFIMDEANKYVNTVLSNKIKLSICIKLLGK